MMWLQWPVYTQPHLILKRELRWRSHPNPVWNDLFGQAVTVQVISPNFIYELSQPFTSPHRPLSSVRFKVYSLAAEHSRITRLAGSRY